MSVKWEDLDVKYDNASQVVTISNGRRTIELQTFTEAQFQELRAIADRICARKRRERRHKQRTR